MEGDVISIMPRPMPPGSLSPSLQASHTQSLDSALSRSPTSPTSPLPLNGTAQKGEVEKWDAWHACAGMSRTEAKMKYIDYLIDTMKKYACGTREGRELVEELEFVWDQIRTNTSNSQNGSGSSDDSRNGGRRSRPKITDARSSGIMHSFNAGISRSGVPAGQFRNNTAEVSRPLRVLSPVSREDGGDISGREDDGAEDDVDDNEDNNESVTQNSSNNSSSLDRRKSHSSDPNDHRKWRHRIESALSRLTVEVAALREQISDARLYPRQKRPGYLPWAGRWIKWLITAVTRQILFDLLLLFCVLALGRWKGDRRLEIWLRLRLRRARGRIKNLLGERGVRSALRMISL